MRTLHQRRREAGGSVMASSLIHPIDCSCDACDPDQDNGFRTFVMQIHGLAAGAVIVGLIEAVRAILPHVERLMS